MKNFEKEVTKLMKKVALGYGLDELTGEIISILFLEPEPVSMEELSERTGYSLSTLSTKLKFMERVDFITRVKKPGSKKAYFYIEKDMKSRLVRRLKRSNEIQIEPIKQEVPKIIEKYKDKIEASKDEKAKQKLKILQEYHDFMIKYEKLMNEFIKKIERLK